MAKMFQLTLRLSDIGLPDVTAQALDRDTAYIYLMGQYFGRSRAANMAQHTYGAIESFCPVWTAEGLHEYLTD